MNTRQTSIDCYHQIKAEGLLSKRRFEVYQAIFRKAPCTSSEAMQGLLNAGNVLSQSRARFTELRELGVIYEVRERKCRITGRVVIEWDLTDNLPTRTKPINTKKNRANHAIAALRELYKNRSLSNAQDWKNVADLIRKI